MRFNTASTILFALFIVFSHTSFGRTPLHDRAIESTNFRATFFNRGKAASINQMQQWILHLEDRQGHIVENARIQIRGGMPTHDHGLPTAPKMTEYLGEGDYLIAGMKFHMAGLWRLEFVITANNHQDTLVFEFEL